MSWCKLIQDPQKISIIKTLMEKWPNQTLKWSGGHENDFFSTVSLLLFSFSAGKEATEKQYFIFKKFFYVP